MRMRCKPCNRVPEASDSDFPRWISMSGEWYCPDCFGDAAQHYEQLEFDLVLDER
jgi:hypothetical protein